MEGHAEGGQHNSGVIQHGKSWNSEDVGKRGLERPDCCNTHGSPLHAKTTTPHEEVNVAHGEFGLKNGCRSQQSLRVGPTGTSDQNQMGLEICEGPTSIDEQQGKNRGQEMIQWTDGSSKSATLLHATAHVQCQQQNDGNDVIGLQQGRESHKPISVGPCCTNNKKQMGIQMGFSQNPNNVGLRRSCKDVATSSCDNGHGQIRIQPVACEGSIIKGDEGNWKLGEKEAH
ncbi:hypothetical protein VNO78_27396 [Psophocarpus tetragonolobus]|uniref:Uncharacterized protein n=1 Tax=Psophocarpus tetragonolobus TaxID=3891 RepID=A0AAN9S142_PSOTE